MRIEEISERSNQHEYSSPCSSQSLKSDSDINDDSSSNSSSTPLDILGMTDE